MTDRTHGASRWVGLAGWAALTFIAAAFGSQFSEPEWYLQLEKPSWAPSPAVFGPVWSVLYGLMAIAAWLVWQEGPSRYVRVALWLYVAQLIANALWSWLFFGLQQPDLALIDIVILWLLIAATIAAFFRVNRLAAVMLVPYILWVSYATALNFRIWHINS